MNRFFLLAGPKAKARFFGRDKTKNEQSKKEPRDRFITLLGIHSGQKYQSVGTK